MKNKLYRIGLALLLSAGLPALLTACGSDALFGKVVLAASVDGQGQAIAEATTFKPGDAVYLSVELRQAYDGLEAKATWKRGAETLSIQELATTRAADTLDPVFLAFKLETAADWPADAYQCELFVPDQGTTVIEFTLK